MNFYLKSIENQSRVLIEASDDIYIMIGQRGEIYHIDKEKFEKTYEASFQKYPNILQPSLRQFLRHLFPGYHFLKFYS